MLPRMPQNTRMSVDVRTGAFEYHVVDMVIPAPGLDIRLERWHNSLSAFSRWSGWRFDWDERLEFDEGDGSIRHYAPGDRLSRFVPQPDGTYSPAVSWVRNTLEVLSQNRFVVHHPNGNRSEFESQGRLTKRVDPFENTMHFIWEPLSGLLLEIIDAAGRRVQATWGEGRSSLKLMDWSGREFLYTFGGGDFLTSYRDPEGNLTRYTTGDTFAGLASVIMPDGREWVRNHGWAETPRGTMVNRQLFANGRAREFNYDLINRTTIMSEGPFEWHGPEPVLGQERRTWVFRWDELGNLIEKTDPLGNVWTYEYDSDNQVTRITDPNLAHVEMTHDSRGNLLTRTNQKGHTWTYEYHPTFPKVTKVTGPAPFNDVTEFTYDDTTGAPLTRKDPLGRTTSYEHDAKGLLKKVTPPGSNPNITEFEYDIFGHLTQVKNGLGKRTTFQHDAVGNPVSTTDPLGRRTTREYDRLDRLVRLSSPLGNLTRASFDGNGNLVTVTDPLNRGTRFEYGPMDELKRVINPAGGVIEYSYDLFHNLTQQVDPNGHACQFDHDALDRQIRMTDPMGQVTRMHHQPYCGTLTTVDAEGMATSLYQDVTCLPTARVFADSSAFEFYYDEEQRRVRASSPQPLKFDQFTYSAQKYGHDPADDTTFSWDGNHRLTQVSHPGNRSLSFVWDEAGRLASLTDIHGTAITYGYDAADRLVTVARASKQTSYQYDDANRLTLLTYPNGVKCTCTYDDDSRVIRMLWEKGSTPLYDIEYRHDRAGNRTRRKVTTPAGPALTEEFNYDALSRLVRVDENGVPRAQYRYDAASNRVLKKRPEARFGIANSEEFSEYDASDELVAMNAIRFRWDRVGRLVERDDPAQANPTRFEWNYAHRLSKVTLPDLSTAEYRYNAEELRTWRREPSGAETLYYWVPDEVLGLSQVLNELDGTGARKADYVLGPNGLIAILDGDDNERYYIFDALGSVLALTDETGAVTDTYAYDEYGDQFSKSGSFYNLVCYAGQVFDPEIGSYSLRRRAFSPDTGGFLSRDPLMNRFVPNPYLYANANPILFIDPRGLNPVAIGLGAAAIACGGGNALGGLLRLLSGLNDKLVHCVASCNFVRCLATIGVVGGGVVGSMAGGPPTMAGGGAAGGIIGYAGGQVLTLVGGGLWEVFSGARDWQNDMAANSYGAAVSAQIHRSCWDLCCELFGKKD